jgi:hypothetical protein
VIWAVALLWLARREYFPPGGRQTGPSDWPVPPGSAFYAVRNGATQIGIASIVIDTGASGLRVKELLRLDPVPGAGSSGRLLLRTEAILAHTLRLRSWTGSQIEGDVETQLTGQVDGDSILLVTLTHGAEVESVGVRLARPVFPPTAVALGFVARRHLRIGRTATVAVLDPTDLTLRDQRMRVAAESVFVVPDSAAYDSTGRRWVIAHVDTVRAWRLDAVEHGLPVQRWIDGQGLLVRSTTPLGLTFERSAFELVSDNYRVERRRMGADSTRREANQRVLVAAGTKAAAPVTSQRLQLALLSGDLTGIVLPGIDSAPGQQRTGDTVSLSMVAPRRSPPDSDASPDLLQPDPLITSGDSAVRMLAASLGAAGGDPWRTAARLTAWVARSIGPEPGGLGTASRTLARHRGNPSDRAVLLVALARAAGIPARTVGGLLRMSDGWHYHVWAEMRAGAWTPADPELGQFPADANHLRLTIGGLGRESDLLPRAGRLRVNDLATTGPS